MIHLEVTPELESRVVEILGRPHSLAKAAELTGLTFSQVSDVGRRHGYPDVAKLREASDALRASLVHGPVALEAPAEAMTGRALELVRLVDLHPDPDNPRADVGDVAELAESIRQSGLLQPIVARRRGSSLIVVAGHRRLAALQMLGRDECEVVISRDMRSDDVLAAMLIENGQRRDLDPIEEAKAFARLKASRGWNSVELGHRVGRSQAYVDGRLVLLELSIDDQELVRGGSMGVVHATTKARVTTGRTRASSLTRVPHLGPDHSLAGRVRSLCLRTHGSTQLVGKTGCGKCWEDVIRADERGIALEASVRAGQCRVCDQPIPDQEAS